MSNMLRHGKYLLLNPVVFWRSTKNVYFSLWMVLDPPGEPMPQLQDRCSITAELTLTQFFLKGRENA